MIIIDTWKNTTDLQLDGEIWKDIKGYEGIYQVSNLGRVKSLDREMTYSNGSSRKFKGRVLKQTLKASGYLCVKLCARSESKDKKTYNTHQLVAKAFIPNPNNYPCINHISEVKTVNTVDNLEWCTYTYNNAYGNHNKRVSETLGIPIVATNIKTNKKLLFLSNVSCALFLGCKNTGAVVACIKHRERNHTVKGHTVKRVDTNYKLSQGEAKELLKVGHIQI